MEPMKRTKELIGEAGVTASAFYVNTPVCCPSRSGMLTGRYIHNIPMTNNSISGNCAGKAWAAGPERQSIGVLMQALGYLTFYGGKYLNTYGLPAAGGVALERIHQGPR